MFKPNADGLYPEIPKGMICVSAVVMDGAVIALFRDNVDAEEYCNEYCKVMPWLVPASMFEFEE